MTKKRTSMAAFETRTKSLKGEKMTIRLPDGTPTNEYLIVKGDDCPGFNAVISKQRKRLAEIADMKKPDEEKQRLGESVNRKTVASLVVGWSFDEDFSQESLCKFFLDSPDVQRQTDQFAANRTNFLAVPPQK